MLRFHSRVELPPRTRRILELRFNLFMASGTTSAYAENTDEEFIRLLHGGNYLRVRGEYLWFV